MRAWQFSSFGVDALEFVERPIPQPGPGEVLVRVRAVSYNFRDLLLMRGQYNPRLALPRIPCSDGAGEIAALGAGVRRWRIGERVAAAFMQNWIDGPLTADKARGALGGDVDGMLAEYVLLDENGLVRIPPHLSFEEAATLPCAAVTAWNALKIGNLQPGSTVLIEGTGGVSIFALQLARLRGARVLGISSSNEKLQRAMAMGLDAGLNYHEHPDWEFWVMEQTDGRGVDLVVEVGGSATLNRALRAAAVGGAIAQVGVLSAADEPLQLAPILHKCLRIEGVYVGSRHDFEELNQAISLAELRPVGENFPWFEAREALLRLEEASHFGKLVLSVG